MGAGAAVNVTRTISLDGKEWEQLLAKAETMLMPMSRYTGDAPTESFASSAPPDAKYGLASFNAWAAHVQLGYSL